MKTNKLIIIVEIVALLVILFSVNLATGFSFKSTAGIIAIGILGIGYQLLVPRLNMMKANPTDSQSKIVLKNFTYYFGVRALLFIAFLLIVWLLFK